MKAAESSPKNEDRATERERALERTLRDALALAVGEKVADHALRKARQRARSALRRDSRRAAVHLAGYGALMAYIWHQRRTAKQPATPGAVPASPAA